MSSKHNLTYLSKKVGASFQALVDNYEEFSSFFSNTNENHKIYVFGGWVRDIIHSELHSSVSFNDLDLIVDGKIDSLNKKKQSEFGGYQLSFSPNLKVDIWELDESYVFRKGIFNPSIKNLLRSTVFDVNSILYEVSKENLIDFRAVRAIKSKTISFNCTTYLKDFPELQSYRAFQLSERLEYSLNNQIREFILKTIQSRKPLYFLRKIQRHNPEINISDIKKLYKRFLRERNDLERVRLRKL